MGTILSGRDQFIGLFISTKMKAIIKAEADKKGVSLSVFLRQLLTKRFKCS